MIRLCVAFADGTFIDEEYPDHEIETLEIMVKEAPQELLVRVELEDRKEKIIYSYTREQKHAY